MSDKLLAAMLILGLVLLSRDLYIGLRKGRLLGPRLFGPAERDIQPIRFKLYIALYLLWLIIGLALVVYISVVGSFEAIGKTSR